MTKKLLASLLSLTMAATIVATPLGESISNNLVNTKISAKAVNSSEDFNFDRTECKITGYIGTSKNVEIPSTIDGEPVLEIGEEAFYENKNITSVVIPDSVIKIERYAFEYCNNLKSVKLPNKLKTIGYAAFSGCEKLESINIPNTVTKIDGSAFGNCNSLKSVTIPYSVEFDEYGYSNLGKYAFGYYNYDEIKPNFTMYYYPNTAGETYAKDWKRSANYDEVTKASCKIVAKYLDLTKATVTLSDNTYAYTGKAVKPKVTVKYDGIKWDSSNFNVSYKNNVNAGTATVTITGKGIFKGTVTKTFIIKPGNVTGIKSASSTNSIKLSWKKVGGANGYIVYKRLNNKWIQVGTTTGTSYSFKKLSAGHSYWYTVKAYKKINGKTYYSTGYSAYKTSTKPATANFKLYAGKKKATVKWSKVAGASGYKIYYKTSSKGKWRGLKTVNSKTTSYTKTKLSSKKTYWFTVKAYKNYYGKTYNAGYYTKSVRVK